jgi:hypothetical protein
MLSDLLIKINPELIFVQLSPDEPMFIRRPKNFTPTSKPKSHIEHMERVADEATVGYKEVWRDFISQK